MKKLDARDYHWKPWNQSGGTFDFLKKASLPVAVEDVFFDTETFDETDYEKNGVHFSFYGSGTIYDYAAVLCDDGRIFFCVEYGKCFSDTFHSADDIRMVYYILTKL